MKLLDTQLFIDYNCYKNFHKKMNRWQVCLVNKNNRNIRKTILYSKYLMNLKENRILSSSEEVDHIDNDKTNDDINNLQIITRKQNKQKYDKNNPAKIVKLICPFCSGEFTKKLKNSILVSYNKNKRNFCSRSCSSKFYSNIDN
jgi:hypothetical protein